MFQLRQPGAERLILTMTMLSVVCSLVYGVVAGTFSCGPQLWIAPAKIVMGLMISATICLPSLYIFNCLSGSEARLVEVCGLLTGLLLLMTILLIGFAPVAWIFSQSTESFAGMGAPNTMEPSSASFGFCNQAGQNATRRGHARVNEVQPAIRQEANQHERRGIGQMAGGRVAARPTDEAVAGDVQRGQDEKRPLPAGRARQPRGQQGGKQQRAFPPGRWP